MAMNEEWKKIENNLESDCLSSTHLSSLLSNTAMIIYMRESQYMMKHNDRFVFVVIHGLVSMCKYHI